MKPNDLRVVIVDDNHDAAATLAKLMKLSGFSVDGQISDATTAIDCITKEAPHVVILDIGMPFLDGYTLASRVQTQVVPVPRLIAATGYGTETDRQNARDVGLDAHSLSRWNGGSWRPCPCRTLNGVGASV